MLKQRPLPHLRLAASLAQYNFVSVTQGKKALDRRARGTLGMSGAEFIRRYRAGEIEDPDRPEVIKLAMFLPFTERLG
ncbi:MAG: hypothetical protein H0W06_09540 [Chloroflexia bacterium]|nr:hypothetical protein [Chloroflexia bacterium]